MYYNRGAYNRGAYNRGSGAASIKPLPVRGISNFSEIRPKLSLHLKGVVSGRGLFRGVLRTTLHLQGLISASGALHTAKLIINIRPSVEPIRGLATFTAARLKLYAVESINLTGLVLYPGETLEINTDKITVEVNGVNVIKYWKTGGIPIMLLENGVLTYYDGSVSRAAQMTIIYSDRWL